MFEYISPDGTALPENEVIKLAKESFTDINTYIKKNKLTIRSKQKKKPEVRKEVAKKEVDQKLFDVSPEELKGVQKDYNKSRLDVNKFINEAYHDRRVGINAQAEKQIVSGKEVQSQINDYSRRKQIEDDNKLKDYGDKLGDNVWLSDKDLETFDTGDLISSVTTPKDKQGLYQIPVKGVDETKINLLGVSDVSQKQVPDYDKINDGSLIVNNLSKLQNNWVINNGSIAQKNDLKLGIDTKQKALDNGKDFLSYDEKGLSEKMALLNTAKKNNNINEVKRLESLIKKDREDLGLGRKLYNESTGKLLSIKDAKPINDAQNKKAKELADGTSYNALNAAQTNAYYELVALSKAASKKKVNIEKTESTFEKIGTFIKDIIYQGETPSTDETENTSLTQDIRNLQKVSETGMLPKGLNQLPGKHPISLAFNKKLEQYITLTKAIELNNDPITTAKNSRLIDFVDKTAKATFNAGIYSPTGYTDRKETAKAFNEAIESVGYAYTNKDVLDKKVEETITDAAIGGTAHLVPLTVALLAAKKASSPQLTQAGNIAKDFISKAIGTSRVANNAADIFVGGMKEVALLGLADKALAVTTGAESTDQTFAASLGAGNVIAEKLIKKMVTNKIPFLTPVLAAIATKSNAVSKVSNVAVGAAVGTAVMEVAEGATLVKDRLVAEGNIDQAAEWENLSSGQHIASTFWSLAMMGGFAPKGFYDALKSDIQKIPAFNAESINAGKLLGIEGKAKVSTGVRLQERNTEIDKAEDKAIKALNKKYKGSTDFEAMANEEVGIKKAANVLRGDAEIQSINANKKAGLSAPDLSDVFVATNKIKYGDKLSGTDIQALSTTPMSMLSNQLGLKKETDLYKIVENNQNRAQQLGEQLDGLKIFENTPERAKIFQNVFENQDLHSELYRLNESIKNDPSIKGLVEPKIAEVEKKIENINVKNKELVESSAVRASRDLQIDLKSAKELAEARGKEFIPYQTEAEFEKAHKEITGKDVTEGETVSAFFDKQGNIHVNTVAAESQKTVGTGTHEGSHLILENWMKNSKGNLTNEGVKFIDDWKKTLPAKVLDVIENRIEEGGYATKEDANGNTIKAPKNEYYEEYLTAFSESIREGRLNYDPKTLESFKGVLETALKKAGIKNPKILPGSEGIKEMSDILKSLAETAKTGKVSEKALAFSDKLEKASKTKITKEGVTYSKAKVEEIQKKIDKLNEQFEKDEVDYDTYENQIDLYEKQLEKAKLEPEPEKATVEKPKETATEEDVVREIIKNERGAISSDKVQQIYGAKGVDGANDIIKLFKPITAKIVDKRRDAPGFDKELLTDEIESGKGGILDLIMKYDPKGGVPLAAYINKYLPVRAITSSRRVLESNFTSDVEAEVNVRATETADQGMTVNAPEKPKYKNALESNVLEPEVLKTATNKIVRTVSLLKNRIDAPTTLNRTISPIIAEIRDDVGKQLDIDLKTSLGGKKDNQLRNSMLKAKRYILENMTTTWMMGKDGQGGMPIAIQKRIDGKWVNYPDWVGQKIDRESMSTDLAGRTSGAELVRRLPNVFNNISDADFLAQVIGPDGNPLRGRKESLAKAMAEEIAFDIINADLAEEGPIFQALAVNQERLGYEVTTNTATVIAMQADRGNVKYARTNVNAIDSKAKEFYNLYKNSSYEDRSAILEYLKTKENKALGQIGDNLKTNLLNTLGSWQNAYIENYGKLESKFRNKENNEFKSQFTNINKFDKYFLNEIESVKTSKAAAMGLAASGLDFNKNNLPTINEIKANIKANTEEQLKAAKNNSEKIEIVDKFLRTYRAVFTGGTVGEQFYKSNTELFKELETISGFKDLGYSLKQIGKNSIIIDKNKNNPTFVYEQSAAANDVAISILTGKDVIAKKERNIESEKSLQDVKDFAKWVKDSNMSDKAKAMAIISLGTSTYSPLRTMAKLDSAILDKNAKDSKEYVWEHALPIDEMVRGILSNVLDLPIGERPALTDSELNSLLSESKLSIIPRHINDLLNNVLKNRMPSSWKIGDNVYDARYFNDKVSTYLKETGIDLRPSDLIKFEGNSKDLPKINFEERREKLRNSQKIEATEKSLSNQYSKTTKGISVFDFDDTMGITKGSVLYTMLDGYKGKLNAEEFAKRGGSLLKEGAEFDFSEFSKVVGGKPGPMVEKMKKMIGKFGPDEFFILTARPADAAKPIHEFLSSIGIEIPLENITGLGNSTAQAKADWMTAKAANGYNDFYFADDAIQNVKAVKDALAVLDVKSKIQQAKVKFSKTISTDFNKILEENVGVKANEKFSDVVAKRKGAGIGKYRFFVPPSAADLELLTYDFLGYGKKGEEQQKFFNKALFEPYSNGIALIDSAKQSIKNDYKALLKAFPEVSKDLGKLTPDGNFTYDQALRVSMWTSMGEEIPGLLKEDSRKLNDFVNQNAELSSFRDGLIATGRQGNGWVKPSEYWDSETIISDLHNITDKVGRKKYLGEFIENSQEMFSKDNLNKIETIYGSNFRDALEDSIYSMTNGTNREGGAGRINAKWLNWINNSTGAIMFWNTKSAVLQTVGAINYLNWRDNNPLNAAKAFANQPQYWADFAHIWNSDKMKERRSGLKEDVSSAEIANAAAGTTNKANAVISYLLKKGFLPTQIGDSFAIASGGAPFYRNRIEYNLKQGMSEVEAEAEAWKEFIKVTDQTQQSGDPRDVSQQQRSAAGRLVLAFQNTSMQQARLVKKAGLDLINNRGDAKTNISKIVYYTAVQNIIFGGLQSALFATIFSDDTDEEKKKKKQTAEDKWLSIGNGVLDSVLRGSGMAGAIVATIKNTYLRYNEESKKGFKAEYAKVLVEAANIAPPIGSKFQKAFGAMRTNEFEKDVIAKRGWSVMQDGRLNLSPSYSVLGQTVEAATNLPMNRFVNKAKNVSEAMDSRNKSWQRIALAVGYNPYAVGVKDEEGDIIKAEAKVQRKIEGKEKAIETRRKTKEELRNMPSEERRALREKKREEKRKLREKKRNTYK